MANSVPNPVQRLRYFDGEYLRSYDFTDEQSYHIEMRRLMNLKLHLHGVVYGLEIVQDQDSVPSTGTYFYSISPGMAIDKGGKEIVVPAPYSLTNVLTGPNVNAGSWYEVWICYQESETGLPAAGYLDCNVKNQYTRWQETFQVQLIPTHGPVVVTECGGVRLGVIQVVPSPSGLGLAIQGPVNLQTYNTKRHYVGIRAQSVEAPDHVDPDNFDITATKATYPLPDQPLPGYLDVHPGVFNHGNVIVKKNLVVGDDFKLTGTGVPSSIPATGNLKITNDLFLNGNFYGYSTSAGAWYSFDQYIQSFTPKFVVGPPITIQLPPLSDSNPKPGTSNTVTSNQFPAFPSGSAPQVMLAITEMDWLDPGILQANWSGRGPITVNVVNPAVNSASPGFNTLSVQWNVGPVVDVGSPGGNWEYPVTKLVVSFVVIYQP